MLVYRLIANASAEVQSNRHPAVTNPPRPHSMRSRSPASPATPIIPTFDFPTLPPGIPMIPSGPPYHPWDVNDLHPSDIVYNPPRPASPNGRGRSRTPPRDTPRSRLHAQIASYAYRDSPPVLRIHSISPPRSRPDSPAVSPTRISSRDEQAERERRERSQERHRRDEERRRWEDEERRRREGYELTRDVARPGRRAWSGSPPISIASRRSRERLTQSRHGIAEFPPRIVPTPPPVDINPPSAPHAGSSGTQVVLPPGTIIGQLFLL